MSARIITQADGKTYRQLNVTIPSEIYDAIRQKSHDEGTSYAAVITWAIRATLHTHDTKKQAAKR